MKMQRIRGSEDQRIRGSLRSTGNGAIFERGKRYASQTVWWCGSIRLTPDRRRTIQIASEQHKYHLIDHSQWETEHRYLINPLPSLFGLRQPSISFLACTFPFLYQSRSFGINDNWLEIALRQCPSSHWQPEAVICTRTPMAFRLGR